MRRQSPPTDALVASIALLPGRISLLCLVREAYAVRAHPECSTLHIAKSPSETEMQKNDEVYFAESRREWLVMKRRFHRQVRCERRLFLIIEIVSLTRLVQP